MTQPHYIDREAVAALVKELRLAACGLFSLKNEKGDYGYFDTIADRLQALAVIPTEGLGSNRKGDLPTERSERPEVVLQYAQQVATYAAKRVGCVEEWRPLEDVYGCLTQIDNCLTGLVAEKGKNQ